ncbi:MAG: hypothetical protein JNK53_09050, partial [Phycisphaerae bacterium]|nr:hypothetical protein [Phycisphaerae bacterium]
MRNLLVRSIRVLAASSGLVGALNGSGIAFAIPPAPVPMDFGTIPHPTGLVSPSSVWQAQGPWLDHETIASGVYGPDEVLIYRTDGTTLETIPNPDETNGIVYFFGCAVEHLDGTLFVLAGRAIGYSSPVLHAF